AHHAESAAERLDPVSEPAQARTGVQARSSSTIVANRDGEDVVASGDLDSGARCLRVLADISESLRAKEVNRDLDRGREATLRYRELDGNRSPTREIGECRREADLGQHAGMDPACELA